MASLHGKRYPTTNIRNVPPFQQRQLNINRWPRSFGTDISLRYIVLIGVIRPSPRPVTPLDIHIKDQTYIAMCETMANTWQSIDDAGSVIARLSTNQPPQAHRILTMIAFFQTWEIHQFWQVKYNESIQH